MEMDTHGSDFATAHRQRLQIWNLNRDPLAQGFGTPSLAQLQFPSNCDVSHDYVHALRLGGAIPHSGSGGLWRWCIVQQLGGCLDADLWIVNM